MYPTSSSFDSHDSRPRSETGHHAHIRPKRDHRTTQYRAQHLERHGIQLVAELNGADGEDADRECEPPPAHVEPDLFSAGQVEDGGCGED